MKVLFCLLLLIACSLDNSVATRPRPPRAQPTTTPAPTRVTPRAPSRTPSLSSTNSPLASTRAPTRSPTTTTATQSPTTGGITVPPTINVVTSCTTANTVAITFDDGPFEYTTQIVNAFNAAGGKVTFFMNGQNYRCIYDLAEAIQLAVASGHQVAHHGWGHADLTTLSSTALAAEFNQLSTAFSKILGKIPTYMRPSYGSYNANVVSQLRLLGFKTVTMWDYDSGDSLGATVAQQQAVYNNANANTPHIFLHHETNLANVNAMVPFIINWANSRGLRMVTVGECLGDAPANWYRNPTTPETRNPTWVC